MQTEGNILICAAKTPGALVTDNSVTIKCGLCDRDCWVSQEGLAAAENPQIVCHYCFLAEAQKGPIKAVTTVEILEAAVKQIRKEIARSN